jgi:hypothetical protein
MNYYDHPYVSNSDLTALKREVFNIPLPSQIDKIFAFGSLVDAMCTEEHLVNYAKMTLQFSPSNVHRYTLEDWNLALAMKKALISQPYYHAFARVMKPQHEVYKTISGDYQGSQWKLKARCKFDLYSKSVAVDLKTTKAKSMSEFINSIDHFDYDRQAAWYMDLAGVNWFWILGVSKFNQKVFPFAICKGDKTYEYGKSKYNYLAYHYNLYF